MRCARLCPHNAGKVSGSMVSVEASPIKKACSVRKRKRTIILKEDEYEQNTDYDRFRERYFLCG